MRTLFRKTIFRIDLSVLLPTFMPIGLLLAAAIVTGVNGMIKKKTKQPDEKNEQISPTSNDQSSNFFQKNDTNQKNSNSQEIMPPSKLQQILNLNTQQNAIKQNNNLQIN